MKWRKEKTSPGDTEIEVARQEQRFLFCSENSYVIYGRFLAEDSWLVLTQAGESFLRSMAMKIEKTVSTFFSIAFIGAFAMVGSVANAAQNALAFHGQLVNAGCDAQLNTAAQPLGKVQPLSVNGLVTINLNATNNACGATLLPVVAHYAEQSSRTGARNGVVTLTYQ